MRGMLLRLHRWAGLGMAAFLTLAGLSGSIIAFQYDLDAWLNPALYRARDAGPALSPDALATRLAAQLPEAEIRFLVFHVPPGQSVPAFIHPRTDPATGKPFPFAYDQVFLDPASGRILGQRQWGACCFAAPRLIPFLYRFHYTLAGGYAGQVFMGAVAILWALDCFVGLTLTFPRGRPFLAKWRIAWTIKRGASAHRLTLDLHRAGALWLWLLLLLMAISGVALALEKPVFRPVLSLITRISPSPLEEARARPAPRPDRTRIGFDRAVAIAAAEGARQRWEAPPGAIHDVTQAGVYAVYFFDSPSDHGRGWGRPVVYIDDSTGAILHADVLGKGTTGDTILRLQFPLHSGQIAGLPGRIAVSVLGLVVAMLSVTGVLIWARKQRARVRRPARAEETRASMRTGLHGQPSA